jgi:hypothetical protein
VNINRPLASLCLALLLAPCLRGEKNPALLRIDGAYLAFSYDHSQIYGEGVSLKFGPLAVESRYLKIDLTSRAFMAYGGVVVTEGESRAEADAFPFDPAGKRALLISYGDAVKVRPWPESSASEDDKRQALLSAPGALADVNLVKIRQSLLYLTAKTLEISDSFEVKGYDLVIYVEGIASVGFKSLKLSSGAQTPLSGVSLDKVWYTGTQGLFAKASYVFGREKKLQSSGQAYYEEHSVLKNYSGLPRQLDFQTTTTLKLNEGSSFGLGSNYNSTSQWNARVWFDKKWSSGKQDVLLDFNYNKPLMASGESWLGLQSSLDLNQWGRLSLQARTEVHQQVLANVAYSNTVLRKINIQIVSDYSKMSARGGGSSSQIYTGNFSLSYNANLLSIAGDYFLNDDLFGHQRLTRPQMRVGFNPVTFYGGILSATLQSVFVMNNISSDQLTSRSFSENLAFNLSTRPIFFRPDLSLQVNLAAEQFLEKEGRNFTSGGLILRGNKSFGSVVFLEAFYSFQSRRKTAGWLIEGTSSQDFSGVLRLSFSDRLKGWVSVSYDPKAGEWKQSFADLTIGLIRNWKFQSLLSYDFFRKKISNVDLYLIRRAGRLDLRLIWRSISKQVLVELIPAF